MESQAPRIEIRPTPQDVAYAAADHVVSRFRAALQFRETFTLGLAGGSTPKALYELLAGDEFRRRIEWARVEVFFGDERCVPPDHADSNFKMAKEALLDHVPIPGDNVYRMKGELDAESAAVEYGRMLKERFGDDGLDLLLVGMGDDGHTLSLFPGTSALDEREHRCVANYVEKLDAWRITLTAPFANRSDQVLALITGDKKSAAVARLLEGDFDPRQTPIQLIRPGDGHFTLLLDAAAAGMHEED